jgi:hypothetical protein
MTAQETKLFNAFETTLTSTMGSSDTTFNVNAVVDSYPTTLSAPFYIVINPDSATNREVVLVTAVNTGTKQLTTSVPNRYLPGSAASSGLSHSSGTVVRMAPLQQHIEDINDRVDANFNEAGTQIVAGNAVKDEDNMSSDSATHLATQQSIKAYVDTQLGASDLDLTADTGGPIAIDLDTDTLDLEGGTGIATTASTNKISFGIDSTVATLTGSQTLTNKTLTSPVLNTSATGTAIKDEDNMASDSATHLATQQSIKAYVDSNVTAQDLDITDGSTTSAVDLDSQTLTIQGTANEATVGLTGQTFTIGLPSSITANVTGALTGNASTATALATARDFSLTGDVAASAVSFDGSGNVSLSTTIQPNSVALGTDTTGNYVATVTGGYGIDSTGATTGEGIAHTLSLDISELTVATAVAADYVAIEDVTDGSTKKALIGDIIAEGDITAIVTGSDSGLAGGGTQGAIDLTLDANNLSSTTAVTSDFIIIQDVTNNSTKKALISDIVSLGDITEVAAGTNLNGGGTSGVVTVNLDTTITGLSSVTSTAFVGALTGNATTATTLQTARTIAGQSFNGSANIAIDLGNLDDVTIGTLSSGQVLKYNGSAWVNGSADGDISAVNTAANSGLAGGATSGDVNLTVDPSNLTDGTSITVDTANDFLILEDVTNNTVYKVNPDQIASGSANALIVGNADFTLTDGLTNGIDYDLNNTDMATWNAGGIALTTAGGIFTHHQTQAATYTVAANTGSVMAGPITITGTVTNNGTLVVI